MADNFRRITDPEIEKNGIILYADHDWTEIRADLMMGVQEDILRNTLKGRNIVKGLIDDAIKQGVTAANSGETVQDILLAEGRAPRNGRDGGYEFLVDIEPKKVEVEDEDGNVDFRDLNLIRQVQKGQKIMRVMAADPGEEGVNVQGKALPCVSGQKAPLIAGRNVVQEGDLMVATMDGNVEWEKPLISVQDEFIVNKDVDFTIGHLNFSGNLIVEGNVNFGFNLKSNKDIIIKGQTKACNLEAGGNIIVEQGIFGGEDFEIRCGGSLTTKFINDAKIVAGGEVLVHKEIVRSNIQAMGKVVIEHGDIRGGEVWGFDGILAKVVGSPMGTPTHLAVGVNVQVDQQIQDMQNAIESFEPEIKKMQVAIDPFLKNPMKFKQLPPDKQKAVGAIAKKIKDIQEQQKKYEEEIQALELQRYDRNKDVKITNKIASDVTIQIAKKKKKFTDKARAGRLVYDKESFDIAYAVG